MSATPGWHRVLGRTGVKVSALTLGTMNFGPRYHPDDALSTRVIHAALDAGINVVDTADVYGSEEVLGRAIKNRRGWLSGRWRRGESVEASARANGNGARHDPHLAANVAKREAAERLGDLADEVGIPLASLSIAWILRHPAVTSVIIGPRTPEQVTQLVDAAALALDDDLLDAIDAIVPPGVTLNPADRGWTPPWIDDASRRRRPLPTGTKTVGGGARMLTDRSAA